jgi:hypothetical protein
MWLKFIERVRVGRLDQRVGEAAGGGKVFLSLYGE